MKMISQTETPGATPKQTGYASDLATQRPAWKTDLLGSDTFWVITDLIENARLATEGKAGKFVSLKDASTAISALLRIRPVPKQPSTAKNAVPTQIGRASCRERDWTSGVAVT